MLQDDAAVMDPYHSRGSDWELTERQDPAIWGERQGAWDRQAVDEFERNGFRLMPNLLSQEEADQLLDEAQQLAETADRREASVITEPDSDVVRSIFRVHLENELFRRVCTDPRIVDAVRQLLGSEVYIHQSRINYKPALDGKEFFWHSDFETWHMEDGMPRMRAVSVSLSLTESNEFNGPLMIVPGSHHYYVRCIGETPEHHYRQSLKKQRYGVPAEPALRQLVEQGGIRAAKGPAGTALFFECNVMHGSVGNLSPYPRTNLFVVYNSVENRATKPFGLRPPRPEFLAERDAVPISQLSP